MDPLLEKLYPLPRHATPPRLVGVRRVREAVAQHPVSGLQRGAYHLIQVLPPGVYIAMNGQHFAWDRVRKNRASGVFEAIR